MMNIPLSTVVIPTYKRPDYLPRAVRSALECMGQDIEVIVVPNGGDSSWRTSLQPFLGDSRLRVEPITVANVNEARNYGLKHSRGKYIRFLDDDDYLLPGAFEQPQALEASGAEVCSGRVCSVGQDGVDYGLLSFPEVTDFACAAIRISGMRLPVGNLYLKSALTGCCWDTNVDVAEDYAWMLDLIVRREWIWDHVDKPVGVWFQHNINRRTLRSVAVGRSKSREDVIVTRLFALHDHLIQKGRINRERDAAVAAALWHFAHSRFPHHPIYWHGIARKAMKISPDSRPEVDFLPTGFFRWVPVIAMEYFFVPVRRVTRLYKNIRNRIFDKSYIRKL